MAPTKDNQLHPLFATHTRPQSVIWFGADGPTVNNAPATVIEIPI